MDTSETYIKMCEKVEEIQREWKPKEWDTIVCMVQEYSPLPSGYADKTKPIPYNLAERVIILSGYPTDSGVYGHGIEENDECTRSSYEWKVGTDREIGRWLQFKQDHIWLPRQDQLQEMLLKGKALQTVCAQIYNFSIADGCSMHINSMEQLWLAFVMHEKYHKTWDGTTWLEEKG